MIFTSIAARVVLPGALFFIVMIFLTLILGRFFCGWVCPLGSAIDWVGALKRKSSLNDKSNAKVRLPKFIILSLVAGLSFFGTQVSWIFDPVVIMARFVSLNLIPSFTLALDRVFISLIRGFNLYGGLYDFYRALKTSILGIKVSFFSNSLYILAYLILILIPAMFIARFWCRSICPLGGLYSLLARFSLLKRYLRECANCKICKSNCRMGAIKGDPSPPEADQDESSLHEKSPRGLSYNRGECILCMDCVYDCPRQGAYFSFAPLKQITEDRDPENKRGERSSITRKEFLILIASSIFALGLKKRRDLLGSKPANAGILRPPGSSDEEAFLNKCVRCGNCMKVCPTNALQPVMLESGLEGIWTPRLVPVIGWCEYNCNLCAKVCPTQAIPRASLAQKKITKIGLAKVDRPICLAWEYKLHCLVCEEHCPIPDKAIKVVFEVVNGERIGKPYVDRRLCIGCGICENKCPARPGRAIRVKREDSFM
ncbi:4Fe-4S binding protein [Candidatus Omnitrophota bacterium]